MLPGDVIWRGNAEGDDVYEEKTPMGYFEQFFDEEVFELMTSQINLYAMETLAIELKCLPYEMRRYIGVLLYTYGYHKNASNKNDLVKGVEVEFYNRRYDMIKI